MTNIGAHLGVPPSIQSFKKSRKVPKTRDNVSELFSLVCTVQQMKYSTQQTVCHIIKVTEYSGQYLRVQKVNVIVAVPPSGCVSSNLENGVDVLQ